MYCSFDRLPQSVRERLVGIAKGPSSPAPVVAFSGTRGSEPSDFPFYLLALAAVPALAFLLGLVPDDWFRSQHGDIGLCFLAIAVAAGIAILLRRLVRKPSLVPPPYVRGCYLVPNGLFELGDRQVRVLTADEVGAPQLVRFTRSGVPQFTSIYVRVAGEDHHIVPAVGNRGANAAETEVLLARWIGAMGAYKQAVASGDTQALAAGDPFHECRALDAWQLPEGSAIEGPRSPPHVPHRRLLAASCLPFPVVAVLTLVASVLLSIASRAVSAAADQALAPDSPCIALRSCCERIGETGCARIPVPGTPADQVECESAFQRQVERGRCTR